MNNKYSFKRSFFYEVEKAIKVLGVTVDIRMGIPEIPVMLDP